MFREVIIAIGHVSNIPTMQYFEENSCFIPRTFYPCIYIAVANVYLYLFYNLFIYIFISKYKQVKTQLSIFLISTFSRLVKNVKNLFFTVGIAISSMVVSLSNLGFPMNVVHIYPRAILIGNRNKHMNNNKYLFCQNLGNTVKMHCGKLFNMPHYCLPHIVLLENVSCSWF